MAYLSDEIPIGCNSIEISSLMLYFCVFIHNCVIKLFVGLKPQKVGITAKAVEKHLARLKADGIIERIGPAKGGWWKVI